MVFQLMRLTIHLSNLLCSSKTKNTVFKFVLSWLFVVFDRKENSVYTNLFVIYYFFFKLVIQKKDEHFSFTKDIHHQLVIGNSNIF